MWLSLMLSRAWSQSWSSQAGGWLVQCMSYQERMTLTVLIVSWLQHQVVSVDPNEVARQRFADITYVMVGAICCHRMDLWMDVICCCGSKLQDNQNFLEAKLCCWLLALSRYVTFLLNWMQNIIAG